RQANKFWLFKLKEVNNRDEADEHKDNKIFVDEKYLPALEEGEFFIHDLIDASLFSTENEGLGKVTDYFENGEQGICEVNGDKGRFLFPITDEIFKGISLPDKKIIIQLVPGLIDLNK
ncbi:MAG: 16S rRNA processing protein RimM, partial [Proteobacteria bacterium]|nr:16S rRNA processing protein RimM [Pseudomonadota bacterium]